MSWHNANLKEIYFNNNLEIIDEKAFYTCINLNNINIPDSVQNIGKYAFLNCNSLNIASIPKHLEKQVKKNNVFPKHTKVLIR